MKKYKPPGSSLGIPAIWIVKPNGEQAHFQMGAKDFVQTLNKFGKELAAAASLSPKQLGLIKAAAKEAEALLEEGKFISAYERMAEFAEDLESENKTLTKVKATVKKIEQAAIDKITSATELVESSKSEGKKLDGAWQLTVIKGSMGDVEAVADKAESAIKKLSDDAAREEDTAKAKKLYEKLIADYKDTEAAKRAKAKLDDLGGGN
jgi:hypothetical protein